MFCSKKEERPVSNRGFTMISLATLSFAALLGLAILALTGIAFILSLLL